MVDYYLTKTNDFLVEANQLTSENAQELTLWCGGVAVIEHDALDASLTYSAINVSTSNGMVRAQEGDWVLRLPEGKFMVLRHRRFKELYDPYVGF